ncbi:hypothetical protein [Bifidobacterium adolescentis]|jgi:hypothetical protein|uniref:hypothetical protein n=1 Tax=Bifidobacterium adolescentis TaxID=1680 RepID=UPI001896FA82|nr:hypothetical protein [Bifidobacterium adolescentis]MDB1432715.1 hypothetical protein [Bifidobacterium adolescentis]MDB1544318.1 hypothetical protein [Bifidobacterium adolescentis]
MTYDRKDPNEVLVHAQEATWEDGQRLGVKDGPFGLISCQPLKAGVALSFDTPDDQHGTVLLTREMAAAFGRWLIRQAEE